MMSVPFDRPEGAARTRRVQAKALFLVAAAGVMLAGSRAEAGAYIPAAGSGDVSAMVRYAFGDQAFLPSSFSSSSFPSSKEEKTQLRVTGEEGLGSGFSLTYDLRYGFLYRAKTKHGRTTVNTNDGLQDEEVGLDYGLTQTRAFSDAIGLSLVVPGSSAVKIPGLDSGHYALEPAYMIAFRPGVFNLTAFWYAAPRVFTDGGMAQFRTELELEAPVLRRLDLAGKVFFVRSAQLSGYNRLRDVGELYNLLRLGVEARYKMSDGLQPFVAYEDYVAGKGGHAAERITIGIKISF